MNRLGSILHKHRHVYGGLALGLFWLSQTIAAELPQARPEEVGLSTSRLAYMDEFFSEKIKNGELAGVVTLVARHGKVAHLSALGYANVESRQKMTTDSIFRLYSMTKPIAAVALMQLYEQGRFDLTDPLSKYIPEFANLKVLRTPESALDDVVPLARPPTVQDALRHTAGLSHGLDVSKLDEAYTQANLFGLDVSLAQMMTQLAKLPLDCQPGTKFVYSVGPDVQARLVEILSGMPFDRYLQEKVFAPLGMKDTGFAVPAGESKRLVTLHWDKNGKLTPLDDKHGHPQGGVLVQPWSVNSYTTNNRHKGGSFGLIGTAEDYWRFAQMMLNAGELSGSRLLSPATVRYMTRDHLESMPITDPSGKWYGFGFGLGFAVMKDPAAAGYMDSEGTYYWAGAAGTQFWIDPKEDLVVVALIQHMETPTANAFPSQVHALVYSALQ